MNTISAIFNFENIGGKIKNLAKWSCWITIFLIWIAAPISFFVLLSDDWTAGLCWIPLVGAIVGPVFVWIGNWAMYAFGEFVEDIHAMRNKEGTTTEVNANTNQTQFSTPKSTTVNIPFEKWNKAYADQGKVIGVCGVCGKKNCPVVFAEFEDFWGKAEKNMCYDCCSKRDYTPKRKIHITKMETDETAKESYVCKCGERFYGETCPNCGRTLKDL